MAWGVVSMRNFQFAWLLDPFCSGANLRELLVNHGDVAGLNQPWGAAAIKDSFEAQSFSGRWPNRDSISPAKTLAIFVF
jgi:hypothetical protein